MEDPVEYVAGVQVLDTPVSTLVDMAASKITVDEVAVIMLTLENIDFEQLSAGNHELVTAAIQACQKLIS